MRKKIVASDVMVAQPVTRKLARFIPVLLPVSLLCSVLLTGFAELNLNVVYPLAVYNKITVDVFGAVLPAVLSVVFLGLYLSLLKGSFLRFLGCFLFAFVLTSFSLTPVLTDMQFELQGLAGILGVLISLATVFIVFFDEYSLKNKMMLLHLRYRMLRNYAAALLLVFSVSALSGLLVDLSYAPFLNQDPAWTSVNIGGAGLNDGILLSGLFGVVWTTFFVSLLALIVEFMGSSRNKGDG